MAGAVFPPCSLAWGHTMVVVMAVLQKDLCQDCCIQCSWPHSRPLSTHASARDSWKLPWMEEPSRLQSTGPLGVGYDWVTSLALSLFTFMHWRRKWQLTPVFLPGESQGWGEPGGLPSPGLQSQTRLKWLSSSSSSRSSSSSMPHMKMEIELLAERWRYLIKR